VRFVFKETEFLCRKYVSLDPYSCVYFIKFFSSTSKVQTVHAVNTRRQKCESAASAEVLSVGNIATEMLFVKLRLSVFGGY
jgi:hypothetical protein